MRQHGVLASVIWLFSALPVWADAFDQYTNVALQQIVKGKDVVKVAKLTPELMVQHSRVLPGIPGTFLIVQTNEGRYSKLLAHPAGQRVDENSTVPMLLIERFITFREDTERAIKARGESVRVFAGFRFSLDIGQVVPKRLPADLLVKADADSFYVEPVGDAAIFIVKKHVGEATPKATTKVEIGAVLEPRHFNGQYKLYDDGRRSGTLRLEVQNNGDVGGFYYSDKDGSKYPVTGKIGRPPHAIDFQIMFPQSRQTFRGFLFSGDGSAIAGTSRMQERESGFYATRIE
jgi:hypothetical protein